MTRTSTAQMFVDDLAARESIKRRVDGAKGDTLERIYKMLQLGLDQIASRYAIGSQPVDDCLIFLDGSVAGVHDGRWHYAGLVTE